MFPYVALDISNAFEGVWHAGDDGDKREGNVSAWTKSMCIRKWAILTCEKDSSLSNCFF